MPLALSETAQRGIASAAIVAAGIVIVLLGRILVDRSSTDRFTTYHGRRALRNVVVIFSLLAIALTWKVFAGRGGLVIGLATAGIAFAMQEVVGAVAGWFNIVSGRIYRVGDRVSVGGVNGDVIDVSPLRTKLMEIGQPEESASNDESWVHGRQYTGRIVTVSNKATFTQPVYNYTAVFEYIWDELMVPIAYRADWQLAEQILLEEARQISSSDGARQAIDEMAARYPMPQQEVEPRVFVRGTDDWAELRARFVVPVRRARTLKSDLTRRVLERFEEAGIEIASETAEVTLRAGREGSSRDSG